MTVPRAKYEQLADKPGFMKLRATCPILAIWNDHDYGADDDSMKQACDLANALLFRMSPPYLSVLLAWLHAGSEKLVCLRVNLASQFRVICTGK